MSEKVTVTQGGKHTSLLQLGRLDNIAERAAEEMGLRPKREVLIRGRCPSADHGSDTVFVLDKEQELRGDLRAALARDWTRLLLPRAALYFRCTTCPRRVRICVSCQTLCETTASSCAGCGIAFL